MNFFLHIDTSPRFDEVMSTNPEHSKRSARMAGVMNIAPPGVGNSSPGEMGWRELQ